MNRRRPEAPFGDDLPADEQTLVDELAAAFPGATWEYDYRPAANTVEIDLRPRHMILNPHRLAAELAEWGKLDYCCYSCRQHFVAASLLDAHRVGVPERLGEQRCLSVDELRHGGLTPLRGIWQQPDDASP